MPNYLSVHKKNFLKEIIMSKANLVPGVVIQFTYLDEDKQITKPLVVVLNPSYMGNLHGLRIDQILPDHVQKLVKEVKLWYSKQLNDKARERLPLLKVNVGTPKNFYKTKLKPLLPKVLKTEDCYREYKLNRISALRVIEYRFDLQDELDEKQRAKKLKERKLMQDAIRKVRAGRT